MEATTSPGLLSLHADPLFYLSSFQTLSMEEPQFITNCGFFYAPRAASRWRLPLVISLAEIVILKLNLPADSLWIKRVNSFCFIYCPEFIISIYIHLNITKTCTKGYRLTKKPSTVLQNRIQQPVKGRYFPTLRFVLTDENNQRSLKKEHRITTNVLTVL